LELSLTVIAYRAGIIAADRATTIGGVRGWETTKIARRDDGTLVGCCGMSTVADGARRWVLAGEVDPKPSIGSTDDDDAQFVIVRPNGNVEIHDRLGWQIAEGPFFALGSGFQLALGAMAHGASAEEAVRIAARFGVGDPTSIDVLRLGSPLAEPQRVRDIARGKATHFAGGY
jgi:20S proteasome alpha/beta subunit